ncbi:MAG: lamin tail domain-containing protein, partial [Chitinophagaceae bacterium]|nr:lamin tail domain-containing protein [Chitinophagaceae bacterium]
SRNQVYGLTVATTSATADIRGISFTSGLASVQNNMIAIGEGVTNGNTIHGLYELISTTGSSVYFNSVYIGGSGVGTQTGNTYAFRSDQTTNTRTFQNNIFMNARSNATTGGKHYAVRVAGTTPNPAGLNLNNNDYFVSGTGGVFGFFNSADVASLAAWQTAVGQDALSLNVDPLYIAPTASTPDLHITSGTTTLESAAAAVAGITVDFDNQTRPGAPSGSNSGAGPDIGADEFDGINPNLCTGTPAQGGTASASSPVVCAGGNITFTLNAPFTTGPGISYQWQTSPAGAGTWSNVVGAVSTVASFPISGNTDVRCLVICVPSGLNTPSTTVTVNGVNCQFNVTRTTGITYTSIAGTGTSMSGWRNTATNTDDNLSTSQPIGFAFPYKGAVYNNFSVSTNGYLTFNVGTAATGSGSGAYGWSNGVFTSTTGTLNALAPFYDDLVCQGNPGTAAGLANGIKYELSGTPGNQVLTVEWIGMETFNNAGPNLNFQVKLYEANGQIDYNYGTFEGFNGTSDFGYSYSLGVNAAVITATPTVAELQTQQVENVQNFLNTANNALGRMPECNTRYTFIPGTYGGAGAGPGVPANDEPTAAQTLPVNASPCTSLCGTFYTSSQATASAGITVCSAGTPGTPDDDVWFSFTATTSQQNITVRGGSGYNPVVQLFSDQGITSIACVNATGAGLTEVINATGLTPSSVYYVRVYHAGTGASQAPALGTTTAAAGMPDFSICINEVVPPPANDDPCGAVPLTVNSTCTPYSDNNLPSNTSFLTATNTTVFGVITPTCTGAGTVNDVWFSFVAPASGTANIDVVPVSGVNPAIQLYSSTGTCPSTLVLTPTGCVNGGGTGVTEQTIASSLTPGDTYYIRVYQHPSGIGGAPVSNSQFSICVYAPLPSCPATFTPANASNACQSGNATTLTWTAGANATGYDVYFDPGAGPATTLASSNQAGLTYNAGILTPGVYSWRIEPRNANGVTVCSNLTFTVVAPPSINITPAGPINLCAPSGSQLLSLGSTSAASPTYQWRNGGVPIAGQTGTTYTATATGLYALTVTDGVTGCSTTSNAVVVTLNPQPTVSISPAAATTCPGVGVALTATATAGSFANIKITEVTLFRTGTGQTSPYPAYITGADLVEISNISATPVDVSGLTFADYASNSSTASHPFTIPASTIIPGNGVLVLNLGTGTDDAPNRYFNTGGTNDTWFSGDLVGMVLKSGSTVIDAVGLNSGYVFNAGTGVSAGDWSGFAPSASTIAGTIRSAATDGNTGADWVQSDGPPDQTIGTYNGGYTPTPTTVTYLWTPATGLFTDALLTIPYTNQDIATVYAAPAATTPYNVLVTSAAGCFNNANVTVTVLPANTLEWTGAVNTDWNNAGNWTCGTIPTTTSNVIVKTGVPNYPVVNLNVEIRSLTITTGATVTVATGFDLKLNGN